MKIPNFIRYIIPRTVWSLYREGGKPVLTIWKQWINKVWNVKKFELKE